MKVAVIAFDGLNELDVLSNLYILNRATRVFPALELTAELTSSTPTVRSMYGISMGVQQPLSFARSADVVLLGSGGIVAASEDQAVMDQLRLDPTTQLIGSQCSGALMLARLGLLGHQPVCTDLTYRPRLQEAGFQVLDQPFVAHGNIGSAGGCLASVHLSAWVLACLFGRQVAEATIASVAPVGEVTRYVSQVMEAIEPYVHARKGRS